MIVCKGVGTMPLTLASTNGESIIKKVCGKVEVKKYLGSLGFIAGEKITVISMIGENVIVKIKESRIAISKEIASKIII